MTSFLPQEKSGKQLRWERDLNREKNALTIMPLPVQFWLEWYDLVPMVIPLVARTREESKYFIPEEKVQAFLDMWNGRLMRTDANYVWLHLGGIECFQTIPNFAKGLESRIRGRDQEVKEESGLKALVERWQTSIPELAAATPKDLLEARIKIVNALEPLMSTLAFGGSWSSAYARAVENIVQARPAIKDWTAKCGDQWNLDLPFGGTLENSEDLLNYRT